MRFVADAHLGGLAHLLRMMGFDTLYDNHFEDSEIERIAAHEGRIDADARPRTAQAPWHHRHGCYVRAIKSTPQVREIFSRLDLARSARPFSALPGLQRAAAARWRARRWPNACRPPCSNATTASLPAIVAGACSGKARTGAACGRSWMSSSVPAEPSSLAHNHR
ncbi:Mut7-C RNAse domain-containing protein [Cupriavidus basilensis]